MSKSVEKSVMEKLASDLFTDEERGYLWEALHEGGSSKEASELEPALELDPKILKEALSLSPEALTVLIEKVASEMSPEYADAIVKRAEDDVGDYITKRAETNEAWEQVGRAMFSGFNKAAQEELEETKVASVADEVSERAPTLARAAGIR